MAYSGADKAIVGKVPVSNDVKLCQFPEIFVLETIVERRDPPVAIVHDLFVLCAFHKPNVIGIDLQ